MTGTPLETCIADLRAAVEHARHAMAEGEIVDFAGLEQAVVGVASEATAAPAARRPALLSQLQLLAQELEGLGTDLRRQRDATSMLQAASAYGEGARCTLATVRTRPL